MIPGRLVTRAVTLGSLEIDDEKAFRHIALYEDLKNVLLRARYRFVVMPRAKQRRWDRALFLNLTYWGAAEGGDVLPDGHIAADVVAHVAWHHLAHQRLGASVDAMLLGESIASAFDLYLVGRLLGSKRTSSFLETQVPAMADATRAAGLSARGFEKLLARIASDPARAFADLRALLFTATRALYDCKTARDAETVFERFDDHAFAPLLHHYELSNWILFTRANARKSKDTRTREVNRALLASKVPLEWLVAHWVNPSLAR